MRIKGYHTISGTTTLSPPKPILLSMFQPTDLTTFVLHLNSISHSNLDNDNDTSPILLVSDAPLDMYGMLLEEKNESDVAELFLDKSQLNSISHSNLDNDNDTSPILLAADDQWFNKVSQSAIKGESFNLLDVLHVDLFEDSASLFETVPIQKLKRTVKKKKEKKKKLKEPLNTKTGVGKEDERLSTIMGVKIKPHLLLAAVKKFGGVDTVRAEKLWSNKVRTTLNLSKTTSIGYSINQCYKKYLEHGYFEEEGGEEEEDQEEEEENPEEEDDSPSSSSSSSPSSPSSSSHAFSSSIPTSATTVLKRKRKNGNEDRSDSGTNGGGTNGGTSGTSGIRSIAETYEYGVVLPSNAVSKFKSGRNKKKQKLY